MESYEAYDRLVEIRTAVWREDIPSPTVPEYVEHHNSIQKILALVDKLLDDFD